MAQVTFRCYEGHTVTREATPQETEIDCLECGDQDNSCYDPDCCGGPWPYFPPMEPVAP